MEPLNTSNSSSTDRYLADTLSADKPTPAPIQSTLGAAKPIITSQRTLNSSLLLTALSNFNTTTNTVPSDQLQFLQKLPFFLSVKGKITSENLTTLVKDATPTPTPSSSSSSSSSSEGFSTLEKVASHRDVRLGATRAVGGGGVGRA